VSRGNHIPQTKPFRWDDIPLLAYKEEDGNTHFKAITRQVLFEADDDPGAEVRYFEIAPGGHSTLERHDHAHSVIILRGRGQALVGERIHTLATHDLVRVPPRTWHQFRAAEKEPLGFLCVVRGDRDKPQRPTAVDLALLRADPQVGGFVRV
jgi:quercetin dioxygenase-like cupin family protein